MGLVTIIKSESQFQSEIATAGTKVVVAECTAIWCHSCQAMAPIFEQLPVKYPGAVFLKVNVDICAETASAQGVNTLPTFIFYRNQTKIDQVEGADRIALETKVRQYCGTENSGDEDKAVAGHINLASFIIKGECESLNEADNHLLVHCLSSGRCYIASDSGEQLIISITFNQLVKLHSIKIKGPADKGPKTVKIFINQPRILHFDQASGNTSIQDLELSTSALEGNPVPLKFTKFQSVQNIQLFIKNNQSGGELTQIDHLVFYGSPISTTNMGEFKHVADNKSECH